MNKIKNVFHRSQKIKTVEERRPQQFVKRHSTAQGTVATTLQRDVSSATPAIDFMELSEMEKPAYSSWWKDLDPFDLKRIDNQTVLKFLNGCHLEDAKLEQILALFETAGDGLTKVQFFAMLRLIAHAQNGRNISPALVYLGAPVPHFHTNAIDAIIKSSSSTSTPTSTTAITTTTTITNNNNNKNNNVTTIAQQQHSHHHHNNENIAPIPTTTTSNNNHAHTNSTATTATATAATNMMMKGERKSWWGGYERRSQLDNNNHGSTGNTRRSLFMGETSFIPPQTPTALFNQPQASDTNMMDYFYPNPNPNPNPNVFSPSVQPQQEHSKLNQIHTNLPYETSIPSTPSWASSIEPKQHHSTSIISTPLPNRFSKPSTITEEKYTHGRSRSAGTASDFMQDFEHDHDDDIFSSNNNNTHMNTLQSSKSSLSLHDLHSKVDTGQSLLLTQKFVYLSPSLRNKELQPNNPFNTIATDDDDDDVIDNISGDNAITNLDLKSPFMDSIDDNPTIASHIIPENSTSSNRVFYQSNNKPNIHNIVPPPVPSQITKPAFPKYTRTNNYLLKRSQSTGVKKDVTTKHQRHKSTGTTAIIY